MITETNIDALAVGKIAGIENDQIALGGSLGVISQYLPPTGAGSEGQMTQSKAELITSGECSVKTSTCVAGDWFTSNAEGLAVKTESGFALGRILQNPVDGVALCVITPVHLA